MLKNQSIVCISSIDWDFLWQQHQETMSAFAKNNNRVLFIENTGVRAFTVTDLPRIKKRIINWLRSTKGFRKEAENLYIYSPLLLPFPYLRIARWINKYLLSASLKRWMKVMEFSEPIIWTFLPTPIVLNVAEAITNKIFIYYCTDNFSATSKAARKVVRYEKKVLQRADVVFAMARNMASYCSQFNKNVTCIPMGVNAERFISCDIATVTRPAEIAEVHGRIIGYIGGVRSSIDQELVKFLASQLPDFTFVFVGPIQAEITKLKKYKNIIFTGQKPPAELPKYIKYFDACIIPYKKDDYTDNISPAKLNEYLIMGKPVISTNLKEVENFNQENANVLYIADNYQNFVSFLIEAIEKDNEILRNRRIEVARNNSWDKKIEQMSEIIETAIKKKEENIAANWQKRLLSIYKVIQRRTIKVLFAAIMVYVLIFYTPLIWFLAEPLKISQPPQKADVVVVFGGGVGESGSPGKSTIERARYAAELYKNRYANRVIFSSGYIYKYNDAENMKLLALSVGVPEKDIILEQKANSAYENAKFTKEILDDYNWSSILLVSSPYNMCRASLVFKKLDKNLKIIYTPVINSYFYRRDRKVKWEQIRAIGHEYLGIIYYWWKGYI